MKVARSFAFETRGASGKTSLVKEIIFILAHSALGAAFRGGYIEALHAVLERCTGSRQ
jgi:hypothetical protein